jgi:hypothetical protein
MFAFPAITAWFQDSPKRQALAAMERISAYMLADHDYDAGCPHLRADPALHGCTKTWANAYNARMTVRAAETGLGITALASLQ